MQSLLNFIFARLEQGELFMFFIVLKMAKNDFSLFSCFKFMHYRKVIEKKTKVERFFEDVGRLILGVK